MGFLSFLGGCSGLSVVFSRASGVLCVSRSFCSCLLGVGGGLRGVPGFGVWRARVSCFLFVGGRVWGASARARFLSCPVLAVVGVGGRVRGARVARFLLCCGGGRVVPGFFCCLLWWGFSGVVFSVRCFSCSSGSAVLGPLLGCGFRGVGGLWGVAGWVRGFFLRLLLYWPGPVWVWVGFCLESLILAQDERWRRA